MAISSLNLSDFSGRRWRIATGLQASDELQQLYTQIGVKKFSIQGPIPLQFAVWFHPNFAGIQVQRTKSVKRQLANGLCRNLACIQQVFIARRSLQPNAWGGAAALLLALTIFHANPALAQDDTDSENEGQSSGWEVEQWYVFTSLYTKHFDPDPDHVNNQNLLGVETRMKNNWVFGLAAFDNSFGQNSQYLYTGYKWDLFGSELWYFKLTGGLLHGYKEPYEDKIPLNSLGVAPAILPTLGFQYKFFVAEVNLAGTAAVTVTAGIAF